MHFFNHWHHCIYMAYFSEIIFQSTMNSIDHYTKLLPGMFYLYCRMGSISARCNNRLQTSCFLVALRHRFDAVSLGKWASFHRALLHLDVHKWVLGRTNIAICIWEAISIVMHGLCICHRKLKWHTDVHGQGCTMATWFYLWIKSD